MIIRIENFASGEVFQFDDNHAWIVLHGNGEITAKFVDDDAPPAIIIPANAEFALTRTVA